MTKKKQLQKQIDELKARLTASGRDNGWYWEKNFNAEVFYRVVDDINNKISKLEQYLNIEYKVTESKREEGYVKKEDVRLGITNGPFVSGPLIPLGKNTGKIMKK